MSTVDRKLAELGLVLPTPALPVANYVPFVITGTQLVVSGQVALGPDGKLADRHKGKLGGSVSQEAGLEAARLCAINVLAQAKAAPPKQEVRDDARLGGFINAQPDFTTVPAVMNGASDLMVAVLGDKGRHARSTIGVAVLPFDCAVEVESLFEIA